MTTKRLQGRPGPTATECGSEFVPTLELCPDTSSPVGDSRFRHLRVVSDQDVVVVCMPSGDLDRARIATLLTELSALTGGYVFSFDGNGSPRANLQLVVDPVADDADPVPALTQRERDVLDNLGKGEPAKRIAQQLGMSLHTCRGHVKSLYRKLKVHSQVEAIIKAQTLGLLDGNPQVVNAGSESQSKDAVAVEAD